MAATQSVPVVDVRRLIEEKTQDGIPGAEWLMDHVHPTISGHQAIAQSLLEQLVQMDIVEPRAAWDGYRQDAYRNHLANLDTSGSSLVAKSVSRDSDSGPRACACKLYGPFLTNQQLSSAPSSLQSSFTIRGKTPRCAAGFPTPHALQATVQKQAGQGDLSVSGFGGVGRPAPSPVLPRIMKRHLDWGYPQTHSFPFSRGR